MPGLFGNLTLAAKALQAHQVALEVTGRNIANVNNAEYSRQRVLLGDRYSVETPNGPEGSGVEVLEVQQLRDALLDRQVIRQASDKASLEAQQGALSDAELALGDRVDNSTTPTSITDTAFSSSGIGGALDDFFNSFETLAASPSEIPSRDAAIQSAQILSDRLNNADGRIASLQGDMEMQLKADVERANALLVDIARLNAEIRQGDTRNSGGAADLIDRRQSKLEELATIAKFDLSNPVDAPNVVDVSLGGFLLVSYGKNPNGPTPLQYEVATPAADGSYPRSTTLDANGNLVPTKGKLKINGVDVTSSLTSGAMHGRYTALTGGMTLLRYQIYNLADQISKSVNAVYTPAGAAATGSFFVTTPTSGVMSVDAGITAASLATGATADPTGVNTNSGDNSFIRAIADLRKKIYSAAAGDNLTGKLGDYVRTAVSTLAQNLKSVNARADEAKVIDTSIRAQRDSVSGVSLDEETTNMMRYQRAYQANAKVISVLDSMLDSVINSMIR